MYSIPIKHHKQADELLSTGDLSASFLLYEKSLKEYITLYKVDKNDVRKCEMFKYINDAFKKAESIKKTMKLPIVPSHSINEKKKCRS